MKICIFTLKAHISKQKQMFYTTKTYIFYAKIQIFAINTYILTRDMCICISMGPQSRTINLGLDSWAWEDRVLCVILRWGFKLSDFGNSFRKNLP